MPDDTTVAFAVTSKSVADTTKQLFEVIPPQSVRDLTIGERGLEEVFAEVYRKAGDSGGVRA